MLILLKKSGFSKSMFEKNNVLAMLKLPKNPFFNRITAQPIFSTIASPNSEHFSSVAPSIWRSRS